MKKTIFYIDDEPWFIEPLVDALRDEGHYVELASNGTDAVDKLTKGDFLPDLIVLDVIMPSGDKLKDTNGGRRTGLKVHEAIRKQLRLRTPIIFLTVVDDPGVEREIETLENNFGIRDFGYLVKPILPTELLQAINKLLDIE